MYLTLILRRFSAAWAFQSARFPGPSPEGKARRENSLVCPAWAQIAFESPSTWSGFLRQSISSPSPLGISSPASDLARNRICFTKTASPIKLAPGPSLEGKARRENNLFILARATDPTIVRPTQRRRVSLRFAHRLLFACVLHDRLCLTAAPISPHNPRLQDVGLGRLGCYSAANPLRVCRASLLLLATGRSWHVVSVLSVAVAEHKLARACVERKPRSGTVADLHSFVGLHGEDEQEIASASKKSSAARLVTERLVLLVAPGVGGISHDPLPLDVLQRWRGWRVRVLLQQGARHFDY